MSLRTMLSITGIVIVLVSVVVVGVASAQSGADGNYVCDDFDTPNMLEEAIAEGFINPSDLDNDSDGTACDGQPGEYNYQDTEGGDPGQRDSAPGVGATTPLPSRIDTGGGYCALNECPS